MNKYLGSLLIFSFLISQHPITAFCFSSISTKQIKNTVAITSGILSIPCFKTFLDLQNERNSLLRSILPNFNGLMVAFEIECNKHSNAYPNFAYMRLWNKFLKTNVEPICPELLPRFHALDLKSTGYCLAGTLLLTAAAICLIDNYVPKKSKFSEIN